LFAIFLFILLNYPIDATIAKIMVASSATFIALCICHVEELGN